MKLSSLTKPCLPVAAAILLVACATPPAKDFGGRWKPVNRYDDATVEIPLALPYTYYAAPMDGTLKTMLTRWSADTGLKLNYKLRSDFTLPKSAASVHTSEARDAATQLSTIFAPQGVSVVVTGSEIVVAETSSIVSPPPAANAPAGTAAAAPEKSVHAPVANAPKPASTDAAPRTP
ncbi:hypothetical protein SAMN02800694_2298 [Luteibacter sp. UNCMF331Sha3.1]|nr:hypothetical protein [Luteibacter sp. UNCMF331Sha3.1]SEM96071.1 hypothetical protein SAMN02800694_2298 [Luteibacter sp. UNCMF331Sha3.1]